MAMRRSFALVLLLAALAPGFGPLVAFADNRQHDCAGHVCECARRCPPKRTAGSDCHAKTSSPDCSMRGACRHDQAAATPVATTVYVAAESVTVALTLAIEPLGRTLEASTPVGFSRLDPRPPRTV
jgi:hypothetical protein